MLHWMKRVAKMRPPKPRVVTLEEVALHNHSSDAWTVIDGVVYNLTDYIVFHPGGEPKIMEAAGKDATRRFHQVHSYVSAKTILAPHILGHLPVQ